MSSPARASLAGALPTVVGSSGPMRPGSAGAAPAAVAVLFVAQQPEAYASSVRQLLWRTTLPVVVGVLYPDDGPRFDEWFDESFADKPSARIRMTWRQIGSVSELVNTVFTETGSSIVVVDDAVALPPEPFGAAFDAITNDARVATVSFLGNASDALSFPTRNLPVGRPPDRHDELSVTRLLRDTDPAGHACPVPYAQGPVVVIAAAALAAVGELMAPASARLDVALADFCARGRARGFVDLCDTTTFITRPSDIAVWPIDHQLTHDDLGWVLHRHPSLIHHLPAERRSGDSAFAHGHQVARVKVQGLHVLVDGSCFGPHEVGTQLATAEVIRALSSRDDVARVSVALPGPVQVSSRGALDGPKVDARPVAAGGLSDAFGMADVAYRPYQPVPGWDAGAWRGAGVRLVVSMLDVIAFHNGGYFASSADWLEYRAVIDSAVRTADLVTVISADVADQLVRHALPVDASRVEILPLGTDHLRADDVSQAPRELALRGFGPAPFALVLGVNYTHKNRDLAMAAHALVRNAGHDLTLVMAGAAVPHGTTRLAEDALAPRLRGPAGRDLIVLPEVSSAERNWLLRHASLVWYPTSAEGFGLVPFEAATYGTPCVSVGFGPITELAYSATWNARRRPSDAASMALATAPDDRVRLAAALRFGLDRGGGERPIEEVAALLAMPVAEARIAVETAMWATSSLTDADRSLGSDVPVLAAGWSPRELADAAIALLRDPDLARRHVEATRRAGAAYRWEDHAAGLTRAFRRILSLPRR